MAEPITIDDGYLIVDLSNDPAFAAAVKDDDFAAVAFWEIAYRTEWVHERNSSHVAATSTGAVSNLIAMLRARGETYLDIELSMTDHFGDLLDERREACRTLLADVLQARGWLLKSPSSY